MKRSLTLEEKKDILRAVPIPYEKVEAQSNNAFAPGLVAMEITQQEWDEAVVEYQKDDRC